MIRTVRGLMDPKDVKLGSSHEHLSMDLRHVRKDEDSILQDIELQSQELKIFKEQGYNILVDCSNQSMHRDPEHLKKLSEKIGIEIVASTGYYLHEYHTEDFKKLTVEEIKKEFIEEITKGINNTNIKAGAIGELATSSKQIFPSEKKVLLAAVEAQKETGCPVFTHVDHDNNTMEHVDILLEAGCDVKKTVIGHMDLVKDIKTLIKILDSGLTIAFDTIGKNRIQSCDLRAQWVIELIKLGYENQILLAQDISRLVYLKKYGGTGYGYIVEKFYPKLKNQISKEAWEKISSKNLAKILDF